MSAIVLRPLTDDDHAALLAIQHGLGARPAWSPQFLRELLTDVAHEHGRNVVVAERDGHVIGAAGWVLAGEMCFGAPVIAAERAVAERLVDALIARARAAGARYLRMGGTLREPDRSEVLRARGFATALTFPTLGVLAERRVVALPDDLRAIALADVELDALIALHNEAFDGVDNTRPIDRDEATALVASGWPAGSGVWMDARGRAAAFVITIRDRDHDATHDHLMIDLIAVASFARRRGLGRVLVDRTVDLASRHDIPEVRAVIASTNTASLALHAAAGFTERWRRDMWQLTL